MDESEGSKMAQELLQPIGTLDRSWALGTSKTVQIIIKGNTLEALEWLRSYNNQLGRNERAMATGKQAKLCKSL